MVSKITQGAVMAEYNETRLAAARILVQQAKSFIPDYPAVADSTQMLVMSFLLDNAIALLPE